MERFQIFYMNAAELLDATIHVYKKTFSKQIVASLINVAIMMGFMFVMSIVLMLFGAVAGFSAYASGAMPGVGIIGMASVVLVIFIFLAATFGAMSSASNMVLTSQFYYGEKPDSFKAVKTAYKSFFRMLGVSIAATLIAVPILALIVGVVAIFVAKAIPDFAASTSGTIVAIVVLYLIVLFFILVAVVNIWVTIPACLFEGKKWFKALSRSIELIGNQFWTNFGAVLAYSLMIYGIQYSFTGFFQLVIGVAAALGENTEAAAMVLIGLASMLYYLVAIALVVVIQPLPGIFQTLIYYNNRVKFEGFDVYSGFEILTKELEENARIKALMQAQRQAYQNNPHSYQQDNPQSDRGTTV